MNGEIDVIVLGLGAMGGAIAERLSRRGFKVLGLEQFAPVHDRGSSHGESRVIRKAYFEDERYVPLMLRAYELWDELEQHSQSKLLHKTGCVLMGAPDSPVVRGSIKAARTFGLAHEILGSNELKDRFGFCVPEQTAGFFEADGGYLLVEKCIERFHARARGNGAELLFNQKLMSWSPAGEGFEVRTANDVIRAKRLVLALGAWSEKFLRGPNLPLKPNRTVQFWFNSETGEDLPVYFQETADRRWIYGFPKIGSTLKVAFHNVLSDCDPDHVDREVSAKEVEVIAEPFKALLPAAGPFERAKTCLYTMTPDEHFALGGLHAPFENVFLAAGFSGHGFKFTPVIAELAEDFMTGTKRHPTELFDPYRFG